MIIKLSECEGTFTSFLKDLGTYTRVDTLVSAAVNGKMDAGVSDLSVKIGEILYRPMTAGILNQSVYEKLQTAIGQLDENRQEIQQDCGCMYYDAFEHELYINLATNVNGYDPLAMLAKVEQ